jgi:hypothetical protein
VLSIFPAGRRRSIRRTAETATRVFTDAPATRLRQRGGVRNREAERAELDRLRSQWREALLAAREALRAEEGVLPETYL